jgi:hypothetical protein
MRFFFPHPTSLRCILILSSHLNLGLPRDLPSGFLTKTLYAPYVLHALPISFVDQRNDIWWGVQNTELLVMQIKKPNAWLF